MAEKLVNVQPIEILHKQLCYQYAKRELSFFAFINLTICLLTIANMASSSRSELTLFERGEIIGAWKCGLSEPIIAAHLNRAPATVHRVIVAYRDCQQEKPPTRTGRPKKITSRDSRSIKRLVKKSRRTSLKEIKEDFTVKKVSSNTLRSHLYEIGFHGRVGVRKPLVTERNRTKRLCWAKERQGWSSEWDCIIWSDESKFELFRGDGRRWVWRRPHERYDVDCLIPTMKSGQDGVMVWGCFTKDGLGPLVRLNGKVTAKDYINVLKDHLVPYINSLENKENIIFQEDNAPIHTARIVKSWKEENNITCLPWPAQSPDMNPIEHLWDELERRIRSHDPLPKNKEELWEILQTEWHNINASIYQNLVNSMPNRIAAVIQSKGNPTKY